MNNHDNQVIVKYNLMKEALEKIATKQMLKSEIIGLVKETLENLNKEPI